MKHVILTFLSILCIALSVSAQSQEASAYESVLGYDSAFSDVERDNKLIQELVRKLYSSEDAIYDSGELGHYTGEYDYTANKIQTAHIEDSYWNIICKYATDSFIKAYRWNFETAARKRTWDQPYVGIPFDNGLGNLLVGVILGIGTDGSDDAIYTGYKITDIDYNKEDDTAIVSLTISADFYLYDYISDVKTKECERKTKAKIKVAFTGEGSERECKMTDLMIISSDGHIGFPCGTWLKHQLNTGKVLQPVFNP